MSHHSSVCRLPVIRVSYEVHRPEPPSLWRSSMSHRIKSAPYEINSCNWPVQFSNRWKSLWMGDPFYRDNMFAKWIMGLVYQAGKSVLWDAPVVDKIWSSVPLAALNGGKLPAYWCYFLFFCPSGSVCHCIFSRYILCTDPCRSWQIHHTSKSRKT